MIEHFELLDLTKNADRQRLLEEFASMSPLDMKPANAIIQLVQQQKCHSVIVERDYFDKDYREEFAHFYSTTFKQYTGVCTRLHFFDCKLPQGIHSDLSGFSDHYIGYCILRPITAFKISRTILRPSTEGVGDSYFVLCKTGYKVNIRGQQLTTHGAPFIQQDTQVGTCAQASLWMAVRYMSRKLGFSEYSPFQITDLATRYISYGRPMPSTGLTEGQMVGALREMGYSPIYYVFDKNTPEIEKARIIYRYIESEIPVILGLRLSTGRGHAVTVVGHTFNYEADVNSPIDRDFYNSVQWVQDFIVNDDAYGPYQVISVQPSKDYYSIKNVEAVIVPLPQKIYMKGEYADVVASAWLRTVKEIHDPLNVVAESKIIRNSIKEIAQVNKYAKLFLSLLYDKQLVTRTYLRSSNSFKLSLAKSDIHDRLKDIYAEKLMPRYIWITEISSKEFFKKKYAKDRLMFGEILIDPTANYLVPCWLSIHLPGLWLTRNVDTERIESKGVLFDDRPYRHFARSLDESS